MSLILRSVFAVGCAASLAASASADFAGQTILGVLTNGSVVTGDTTNATDDNDGFTSGDHFFFIWTGNDDVWTLDWSGGNMRVNLTYDNSGATDLDLFVYRPGGLNDSGDYSIVNTGVETVDIADASAGLYYIVIDSPSGGEGAYELSVTVPAPGAAGLLALTPLCGLRRRSR